MKGIGLYAELRIHNAVDELQAFHFSFLWTVIFFVIKIRKRETAKLLKYLLSYTSITHEETKTLTANKFIRKYLHFHWHWRAFFQKGTQMSYGLQAMFLWQKENSIWLERTIEIYQVFVMLVLARITTVLQPSCNRTGFDWTRLIIPRLSVAPGNHKHIK